MHRTLIAVLLVILYHITHPGPLLVWMVISASSPSRSKARWRPRCVRRGLVTGGEVAAKVCEGGTGHQGRGGGQGG